MNDPARNIYLEKSRIFSISLWDVFDAFESKNSLKRILLEPIRCTGVKERTLWEIARGACVVTGVAPLSLRGWNGDSWNNGGSAYCRIPRGGSHPSWQHPLVSSFHRGVRARAHVVSIRGRSADSTHSSHEDAPPDTWDSCRSVVATATTRILRVHRVPSADIRDACTKCPFAFPVLS